MYGETAGWYRHLWTHQGLSPHVRGNPASLLPRKVVKGSIPACTGKPGAARRRGGRSWVYPRMYGETVDFRHRGGDEPGLSPHVRGNPTARHRYPQPDGSIPACTGKPPAGSVNGAWSRVYPRMYGETLPLPYLLFRDLGLSPHVRGNLLTTHADDGKVGSIPACTGKP